MDKSISIPVDTLGNVLLPDCYL